MSPEVTELTSLEAFLGGVLETKAAFLLMEMGPHTIDEALELPKKVVHSYKSLCCKLYNTHGRNYFPHFPHNFINSKMSSIGLMVNGPKMEWTRDKKQYDNYQAWKKICQMVFNSAL